MPSSLQAGKPNTARKSESWQACKLASLQAGKPASLQACKLFLEVVFLVLCTLPLTGYAFAAAVNIPGFYGSVIMPPASTQLPQLKTGGIQQGAAVSYPGGTGRTCVITQNQPYAIIDWSSFNIGADALVRFYQGKGTPGTKSWMPESTYAALNRIWSADPSLIFGRLRADGKIYLINQNGILFGEGAKVNVNSLTASALNIKDPDFLNNQLNFSAEDYQGTGLHADASIMNYGEINAATGGSVFLIGPQVENFGTIDAPIGQVGLIAGAGLSLGPDPTGQRTGLVISMTDTGQTGSALNGASGRLIADNGTVGMYGRVVNQSGLIRSITAVRQNGRIELLAKQSVTTGSASLTESPISTSSETVDNSFPFYGGVVSIGGLSSGAPVPLIELNGEIYAPSGQVTLNAGQRVYLGAGSIINVGGMWSDEPAGNNLVSAQLNSVELRDSYGQKDGLLQGQTIAANVLTGSSIGDISGDITTRQETALEKAIEGGAINVNVTGGDVIESPSASLDFSGGGIRYAGGVMNTTKLLSGTTIYDISNAPLSLQYDAVISQYTKTNARFGVTESYSGIYYGGASPLESYVDGFSKGGDAGVLTITAGAVALGGSLNGSVTRGLFQTSSSTDADTLQLLKDEGRAIPDAGVLTIDTTGNSNSSIVVQGTTTPSNYGPGSPSLGDQSNLSADILSAANLRSLTLNAASTITTGSDAAVVLSAGGAFTAQAGLIEHYGEIIAPSGSITLTAKDFNNAIVADKEVFLAPGSILDVSGQKMDDSLTTAVLGFPLYSGLIQGGTITIQDQATQGRGVFVMSGARLDVSGGYQIGPTGKISGGNAGSLDIEGPTLMINGDIMGYALADTQGKITGGRLILKAYSVDVKSSVADWSGFTGPDSPIPDDLQGLVINGDRFEDSGFTGIELDSIHGITIDKSVTVDTSLVRLKNPVSALLLQGSNIPAATTDDFSEAFPGHDNLVKLVSQAAYQAGSAYFTAKAGTSPWDPNLSADSSATITVAQDSAISVPAGGRITLNAPGDVAMAGTLEAPSGQISVISTGADIAIADSGRILAGGYNQLDTTSNVTGLGYNRIPLDAGQVTLQASNGNLTTVKGSLIDISGSDPVNVNSIVGGKAVSYREAGNPGSLTLSYNGSLTYDGSVDAQAQMSGLQGGSLTVSRTDVGSAMDVTAEGIARYMEDGFDSLTLRSAHSLNFTGAMDMKVKRQLVLDAPVITHSDNNDITLQSPWITVENTSSNSAPGTPVSGEGRFTLKSSGWIDVTGSVDISGFKDADFDAARDIRLSELFYMGDSPQIWQGQLSTAGDLVLKADRIYTTVLSDFTIQSGGKVTVLGADAPVGGPIYSAGGNLTVAAAGGIDIEKGGTLAAPMGTITLTTYVNGTAAEGSRIYLADGSVVSVTGNAAVDFGEIDPNNNDSWSVWNNSINNYSPMKSPVKAVNIDAPEVIVKSGAKIGLSGGGSLFAYDWQAGTSGSSDPLLTNAGDPYTILRPDGNHAYVIMSDRSVQLPGKAIYLEGGGGLAAGLYSILPAQDAFLPGAIIIEQQKIPIASGETLVTRDGYPVVAGYSTVMGTDIRSAWPTAFSVMSAADVLSQGDFITRTVTEGAGGNLSVKGQSVIIDGSINAAALSGYKGGALSLSGSNIEVQQAAGTPLSSGINFDTPLDPSVLGTLTVAATDFSGKGFKEIDLGDLSITDSITVQSGTLIAAPFISLSAGGKIDIAGGAQLLAANGKGEIDLTTPGDLSIAAGATVHASHDITIDVNNVDDINGSLQSDSGALTIRSAAIFFGNGVKGPGDAGLYLTGDDLSRFAGFSDITFVSGSNIQFRDSFDISAKDILTLDTAEILDMGSGISVNIDAPTVVIGNSGGVSTNTAQGSGGIFTVTANQITAGSGNVSFGGFSAIDLTSQNDFILKGKGSLNTGGADLNISAARVTTTFDKNQQTPYIAADFLVDAGSGAFNLTGSGTAPAASSVPGGTLEIDAAKIDLSGVIEVTGGMIKMNATGQAANDGIFLHGSGRILAQGTPDAPGGQVILSTDNGSIGLDAGSVIDVSAGAEGDAGALTLQAPVGGVAINGDLRGKAGNGMGGSFTLYTNQIGDFAALDSGIGDFTESVSLRARTGNIDILSGQTLAADHIVLIADDPVTGSGQIDLYGTIDASASPGAGTVELYANNDLNIAGTIKAKGTSKGEEDVILSSENGFVNLQSAGLIDLSGSRPGGGVVHLRARQNGDDVNMNLDGTVDGASAVYVEAFRVYDNVSNIDSAQIASWQSDVQAYEANADTIKTRLATLQGIGSADLFILPGIEARGGGDVTLAADWDFNTWSSAGITPGVLTIRAEGSLNINANLVDHPNGMNGLTASSGRDSWAFNLVAGADTSSADYMSVDNNDAGNLAIADQKLVYTESGPIRFASGGDTDIGKGQISPGYMVSWGMTYNLASYDGAIQGLVGGDLNITGGAIQTATGDIALSVGRDLAISDATVGSSDIWGAIRTTGQTTTGNVNDYQSYEGGGSVRLNVDGDVGNWMPGLSKNAWDSGTGASTDSQGNFSPAIWSANYETGTAGIAAMGGGDVLARSGGDFLMQAGAFGQNKQDSTDLIIYSGGNINGRFLSDHGKEEINAMGNFGVKGNEPQVEALNNTTINVSAQGDIVLGSVVNPTVANDQFYKTTSQYWDLTYTEEASLTLRAGGDITISGNSQFYDQSVNATVTNERILPATVDMEAGGNIALLNSFALLPSPDGNLTLIAGGNINSGSNPGYRGAIFMSDMDPANVYTQCRGAACNPATKGNFGDYMFGNQLHQAVNGLPLHVNDSSAVTLQAGGDIANLLLYLPKKAVITAGGTIDNIFYSGQNVSAEDVSEIRAGGDISFTYGAGGSNNTGLMQAGPGELLVEAGDSIDLGNSGGIQSIGNLYNTALSEQGSSLTVLSGYALNMSKTDAVTFFDELRKEGEAYSAAMASGDTAKADQALQEFRQKTVIPLLGSAGSKPHGSGNIDMTASQISTLSAGSDIYVFAKGDLNVGQSFLGSTTNVQSTGITTSSGGAINIFTNGNINVNESRIMTFFGGDITVWSDEGDINAGRGSKTQVNATPPRLVFDSNTNSLVVKFVPPAVGSGIRAVTYDPDGAAGPLQAPQAGDIYAFAPSGVIDAGEAGLAGGKVVLGATHVLNVQNISFSAGSVGVPATGEAVAGIGALSGTGSVTTQATQMASDISSSTAASTAQASQMVNDIMSKWLEVKVIDFVQDDTDQNQQDEGN